MSESDLDVQIRVMTGTITWQLNELFRPFLDAATKLCKMDDPYNFKANLWRKEQMRAQ